jgi:predicted kinase
MATVHLLCGRPGSGKTTFARELEKTHTAVRYTYDEWMVQLYGRSPPADQFETLFNRVSNLIWRIATRNLALGTDVILDKGFWYKRDRENTRQAAAAIGAESKLYFLDAPIDVLRKRILTRSKSDQDSLWINDQAFTEFINRFEPPGDDEDFVLIQTG